MNELDRWVVGQAAAKRAVAIALRSRVRRRRLPPEVAADITPKNILMIGPTGVGKTEIARRLAQLAGSPFIKVEASKFTEVGYVGRDVDSIVRDLVAAAIDMVRREKQAEVKEKAEARAEERLLDLLLPPPRPAPGDTAEEHGAQRELLASTREKLRAQLRARPARRADGRGRGPRAHAALVPDPRQPGRRGDGRRDQGHAPGPVREHAPRGAR